MNSIKSYIDEALFTKPVPQNTSVTVIDTKDEFTLFSVNEGVKLNDDIYLSNTKLCRVISYPYSGSSDKVYTYMWSQDDKKRLVYLMVGHPDNKHYCSPSGGRVVYICYYYLYIKAESDNIDTYIDKYKLTKTGKNRHSFNFNIYDTKNKEAVLEFLKFFDEINK